MDKLGKVMKGLGCCSQGAKEPYTPTIRYCAECPYLKSKIPCTRALARDALELLKAQEPRVMTLEEVKAIPYDADIWIETEYYVGKITIFAATINTKGLRGVMVYGSHKTYDYEAYNKLWRCWTARPTDEQRKTVK